MKRKYKKECTIEVYVGDRKAVTGTALIKAFRDIVSDIYACVPKGSDCYDVTLPDVNEARLIVEEDNLMISGRRITSRLLYTDTVVVSFMHLPPYIEDNVIETFLLGKGITLEGEIKHRLIQGTDVSDGTRYVRVRFPDHLKSLPYSVGFHTLDGYKYYRVIHNNQVKVCFKCNSAEHEMKECPQTKCFKCQSFGHIAKDCQVSLCDICELPETVCDCHIDYDDDQYDPSDSEQTQTRERYEEEFPEIQHSQLIKSDIKDASANSKSNSHESPVRITQTDVVFTESQETINPQEKPKAGKKARRQRKTPKLSDSVLKENELKNKLRENRKDELKKKKEEHMGRKREITVNEGTTNEET